MLVFRLLNETAVERESGLWAFHGAGLAVEGLRRRLRPGLTSVEARRQRAKDSAAHRRCGDEIASPCVAEVVEAGEGDGVECHAAAGEARADGRGLRGSSGRLMVRLKRSPQDGQAITSMPVC